MKIRLLISIAVGLLTGATTFYIVRKIIAPVSVTRELVNTNSSSYYGRLIDLDSNGESEHVSLREMKANATTAFIKSESTGEHQINLPHHPLKGINPIFGDYNFNQLKEVYFFSFEADSLFLNAVEYPHTVILNSLFITNKIENIKSLSIDGIVDNLRQDTSAQLILNVMGGYGATPRNVWIVDIANQSLISSADSIQSFLQYSIAFDLNKDGTKEIIAWGRAPDNNHGSEFFSDQDSYLMTFDDSLRLLHYVKLPGTSSYISTFSKNDTLSIVLNHSLEDKKSLIGHLSDDGMFLPKWEFKDTHITDHGSIGENQLLGFQSNADYLFHPFSQTYRFNKPLRLPKGWLPYKSALPNNSLVFFDQANFTFYYVESITDTGVKLDQFNLNKEVVVSSGIIHDKEMLLVFDNGVNTFYQIHKATFSDRVIYPMGACILSILLGAGVVWRTSRGRVDTQLLRLNTRTGFELIPHSKIIYCRAEGRYTRVETADNGSVICSNNLGSVAKNLNHGQVRLGRSLIINPRYVRQVDRKKLKVVFVVESGTKELTVTPLEAKSLSNYFQSKTEFVT